MLLYYVNLFIGVICEYIRTLDKSATFGLTACQLTCVYTARTAELWNGFVHESRFQRMYTINPSVYRIEIGGCPISATKSDHGNQVNQSGVHSYQVTVIQTLKGERDSD